MQKLSHGANKHVPARPMRYSIYGSCMAHFPLTFYGSSYSNAACKSTSPQPKTMPTLFRSLCSPAFLQLCWDSDTHEHTVTLHSFPPLREKSGNPQSRTRWAACQLRHTSQDSSSLWSVLLGRRKQWKTLLGILLTLHKIRCAYSLAHVMKH